ncbi:Uncharacterised protein [Vibrio cholerae]|nr:Uncharacterised protein [Vibrio cholerae]
MYTQHAAFHFTKLKNLIGQIFHHIRWDGKTYTDVATVWTKDRGVDTDEFTIKVNQSSS